MSSRQPYDLPLSRAFTEPIMPQVTIPYSTAYYSIRLYNVILYQKQLQKIRTTHCDILGAKVPGSGSSRERKSQGAKVRGSELARVGQ